MTCPRTAPLAPLALLALAACATAEPRVMGVSPDRITVAVGDRADLPEAAKAAGDHCVQYDDIAVLRGTGEVDGAVLAHFDCR